MQYSDQSYNLRIELDTKDYECTAEEIQQMEVALQPLHRITEKFPVSDLYITVIRHPRSKDFHVRTSLVLPKRTLFTGDHDEQMYSAYERCIGKLVNKLESYQRRLGHDGDISKLEKGTYQEVVPTRVPDHESLQQAVEAGDYFAFRAATDVYEEPLRKRIGRWIQRYPELQSVIDNGISIADIVEDVFLTAFERFEQRSPAIPPGDWLESLIDPVVKELIAHPDEALENIRFVQSSREAQGGP